MTPVRDRPSCWIETSRLARRARLLSGTPQSLPRVYPPGRAAGGVRALRVAAKLHFSSGHLPAIATSLSFDHNGRDRDNPYDPQTLPTFIFPLGMLLRMNAPHTLARPRFIGLFLCAALAWFLSLVDKNRIVCGAPPAIEGYSDFAELTKKVQSLAKPALATVTALTKSPGGREVWLVTIGAGEVDRKPALLVLGNVEAPHVIGSELALRIAQRFVEKADDEAVKNLLDQYTFYFVPRPNPDGTEAFFRSPLQDRPGNDGRTDDDRDHEVGEDPADDLNGDGVITVMRVEDPAGKHMPHPNDERVLIEADTKKNEAGRYSVYIEGKDDDGDEQFNEDGSSGVSFNRNFTFRYPYFQNNAGSHQVSEPETRAFADFAFNHPNIAAVFCFSPEDNLMHPWKPADQQGRIKTSLQKEDAAYLDLIAEKYRDMHGGKDAPSSPAGQGSFSEWAYFHYGRWSFAARGWWIPKVEPDKKADEEKAPDANKSADDSKNDSANADDKKTAKKADDKKPDSRGADIVNALRWFDREKIDGFVPWKEVKHPDFPDKKVEVGGVKPFMMLNPPAKELDVPCAKACRLFDRIYKAVATAKAIRHQSRLAWRRRLSRFLHRP